MVFVFITREACNGRRGVGHTSHSHATLTPHLTLALPLVPQALAFYSRAAWSFTGQKTQARQQRVLALLGGIHPRCGVGSSLAVLNGHGRGLYRGFLTQVQAFLDCGRYNIGRRLQAEIAGNTSLTMLKLGTFYCPILCVCMCVCFQ